VPACSLPASGVACVGKQPFRLREHVVVERNQPVAKPHVAFGVIELAVRRADEIVDRAVLMEQPGDLVRMTDEVSGKFRRDDRVDPFAVRLGQIDHPPRRRVGQQLGLGVPLERHRHALRAIAAARQLADEAADVPLRATVDERHLRLANQNRPGHRIIG